MRLRVGDIVEVRSRDEILATLDDRGRLDGLPYMPEMLAFSGRRFTVTASAHKTCDTASMAAIGMRRMEHAVHLADLRCDGSAHGGCQNGCLLFWKVDWLKKVEGPEAASSSVAKTGDGAPGSQKQQTAMESGVPDLDAAAVRATETTEEHDAGIRYVCQATELVRATKHLRWWTPWQYVLDVRSGNVEVPALVRGLLLMLFNKAQGANRKFLPRFKLLFGARKYPFVRGRASGRTPTVRSNVSEGALVRVRSLLEIEQTIGPDKRNRGLSFDREMVPYCGQEVQVAKRVRRVIDEKTGRMLALRSDCLILEGVVCKGLYHQFCPRKALPFWREIWLDPEP